MLVVGGHDDDDDDEQFLTTVAYLIASVKQYILLPRWLHRLRHALLLVGQEKTTAVEAQ